MHPMTDFSVINTIFLGVQCLIKIVCGFFRFSLTSYGTYSIGNKVKQYFKRKYSYEEVELAVLLVSCEPTQYPSCNALSDT